MTLPVHVIKCAGEPTETPTAVGQHWINTLTGLQYLSNGTSSPADWNVLPVNAFIDPMTTRGDIIIRDPSNDTERLPVGAAGQVLKSDGTDVSWEDESGGGGGAWGDITGSFPALDAVALRRTTGGDRPLPTRPGDQLPSIPGQEPASDGISARPSFVVASGAASTPAVIARPLTPSGRSARTGPFPRAASPPARRARLRSRPRACQTREPGAA